MSNNNIFSSLGKKSIISILKTQIHQCFGKFKRICKSLSDENFFISNIYRVIFQNQSGREFLQNLMEKHDLEIFRSTFFEALHSHRRLKCVEEISLKHYELLCNDLSVKIDYLQEFQEIKEYDVLSNDGHYIEHGCHTSKNSDGRVFPAGNLFMLNMRTGLIKLLDSITDGTVKNHELPCFKEYINKNHKGRKTIWISDRAYIDYRWWEKEISNKNYIISKAKINKSVIYCGELQFDPNNSANKGVIRDRVAAFSNTMTASFRIIEFINPENNEAITFITTLPEQIPPGVICWLYFLRWKIEKAFDFFKNSLEEKKAWACGENALNIQGHIIATAYNFIHFIMETIKDKGNCEDEKCIKKYNHNLKIREKKAEQQGGFIHPLLFTSRKIMRISSQFFRTFRNYFFSKDQLQFILPIFIERLKIYI